MKVGLEIHQRLDSERKLFSPALNEENEEEIFIFERRLRPVAGETGEIDKAAMHEFLKGKKFIYKSYKDNCSLVEADEEPPAEMDKESLDTVLQICKLLNCKIVDEIQVMRKTVIDGSNTSGFQRTAIVGMDGYIPVNGRDLKIETVVIEEEAARIERRDEKNIYKLNGLGIPLVEITTDASLQNGEEAREAAEYIGRLVRSCKVKRGIGSIRQDVNVSVKGGARVEIKGFQELREISILVENEVKRQEALIKIGDELREKQFSGCSQKLDVTQVFAGTNNKMIKKEIEEDGKVMAINVPDFAGFMKREVGDRTLAKELIGYTKLFGVNGFIHSDENIAGYKLEEEFSNMKKGFGVGENDLLVVIAGKNIDKAVFVLCSKIDKLIEGVEEETRVADGTGSRYARPLPGSSRMYPETDVYPVFIDEKYLKEIKLPKTLDEKETKLKKNLPDEIARQLVKSKYYSIFEEISTTMWNVSPVFVASTLLSNMKELKRKGVEIDKISKEKIREVFEMVDKNIISKDSINDVLTDISKGVMIDKVKEKYRKMSGEELKKRVEEICREHSQENDKVIMGLIMSKVKADGKKVMELLKKARKK